MKNIDAKGKACPMPVMLAKKEMDAGENHFLVQVDNETAVKNLQKLATSQGFSCSVSVEEGVHTVEFSRSGEVIPTQQVEKAVSAGGDWAIFVAREGIGSGSEELGASLMKMFFYTLAQGEDLPRWILFMNAGVKLTALDEQVVEHLRALESRGCEIQVCGTCLNFFGLSQQLKVGTVSNMYDISKAMSDAVKVITL